MRCPDCSGSGQIFAGIKVEIGMGGSYERRVYDTCSRCDGNGELNTEDPAMLRAAIHALEMRVLALEERLR